MTFHAPTAFRKLLDGPDVIVRAAVSDPLMARIAQDVGFTSLALGGFAVGAQSCRPEPLLDLTQLAWDAAAVQRSVDLPIIVDVGASFGESIHVWNTVRRMEEAGVAGIQMEDQLFPKRAHYHRDYQEHTISMENMVDKITTAVETKKNKDFAIVGRSDAFKTLGYDEGIRRSNAYLAAGADAVVAFPNTLEEARRAPKDIDGPVGYVVTHGNRVGRPILTPEELADMGYKLVSFATIGILAYYRGVHASLLHLLAQGQTLEAENDLITARKSLEDLIGLEDLYRIEERTTERDRDAEPV